MDGELRGVLMDARAGIWDLELSDEEGEVPMYRSGRALHLSSSHDAIGLVSNIMGRVGRDKVREVVVVYGKDPCRWHCSIEIHVCRYPWMDVCSGQVNDTPVSHRPQLAS
jgi:hypothetical protein